MKATSIILRSYARKFGFIRFINFFRFRILNLSQKYEERFGHVLLSSVRSGDVVWDVGANLGIYTRQFSDRVGASGRIVAFEPAPACFRQLTEKFKNISSIQLENLALGSSEGIVHMQLGETPLAATHRVLDGIENSKNLADDTNVAKVQITTGDSYWKKSKQTPNLIKIDVEGFEEQVLHGMKELLRSPELRAIFCEVHFALLEERGEKFAPKRIERLLQNSGFDVKWIDASHLSGIRG